MSFPKKFVWGAAAASYQIEGSAYEDGKGLSIWDVMCKQSGKIWQGHTGEVACNFYFRFLKDIKLMSEIGLKAYRMSISWSRVLAEGTGKVNEKGLDFYDKLINTLLENGIQPWVTLFHWDYPHPLFCRGGWLNRDSSDWFAEYTKLIVDKLSDRVTHWMTQNEPQVYINSGHRTGEHAPGLKLGIKDIHRAIHNSLIAHGKAVQVIRANAKTTPKIGIAPVGITKIPATESTEDIEAAKNCMFSVKKNNFWNNTWYVDPMIFGRYPEDGIMLYEKEMTCVQDGDLEIICQPLDFYGVNIYYAEKIRSNGKRGYESVPEPPGHALTTMDWQITPDALYWGPRFLYERYKLPIVITENGMANTDFVHIDGKVHDPQRIDFLTRYLREYKHAIDDGVEAWGYFLWSIMDNFEWTQGYKQRFGLIYVDYLSQKRVLKDSAYWYKQVIATNGGNLF